MPDTGKDKTKALLEKLQQGIQSVKSSEEFQILLRTMAMFHSYSFCNCMLIAMQKPEATRVAGFRTWEKFGRHVKRGEKGIGIFAPMRVKQRAADNDGESDDAYIVLFHVVYVFDISQTEGDPLPTIGSLSLEDSHHELLPALLGFCEERKIKVSFEQLSNCEGVSKIGEIAIKADRNPTEKAVILIHEIAHELIHSTKETRMELTTEQKEMEAEAVAFVVSLLIGIPESNSEKYLALYQKSYDLAESLEVIHNASQEIIKAISVNQPTQAEAVA